MIIFHLLLEDSASPGSVSNLKYCHFGFELGEEQAFLKTTVASSNHEHFLALVKGAITGRAEVYSGANGVFLAGHIQATVPAAGGDQHSVRAVIIATFGIHDFEIASCADAGERLRRPLRRRNARRAPASGLRVKRLGCPGGTLGSCRFAQ